MTLYRSGSVYPDIIPVADASSSARIVRPHELLLRDVQERLGLLAAHAREVIEEFVDSLSVLEVLDGRAADTCVPVTTSVPPHWSELIVTRSLQSPTLPFWYDVAFRTSALTLWLDIKC